MATNRSGNFRLTPWARKFGLLAAVWSMLVGGSLMWNLKQVDGATLSAATASARSALNKDLNFRRWASAQGGIYVPPSAHTPPSAYIHLPDRDVVTSGGKVLTLVSPAYVLRQLQQDFPDASGPRSHLVSLRPLNPASKPDAWERRALQDFEKGVRETLERLSIDGQPYLRVMQPFIAEADCLKCHGQQGYRPGAVMGGIGVSVPLAPFEATDARHRRGLELSHGAIWLIGLLALSVWQRRDRARETELRQATERHQATAHLLRLMCDNVPDMIWAKDRSGVYLFANRAICDNLLMAADTDEPVGKNDIFFARRERDRHPERNDWHTFGELCFDSDEVVLESGHQQRFDEYGNVRGEFLFLDVYKAPLLDEQGRLLGTVGSGRIVTREKQIEAEARDQAQALRENEQKYHLVADYTSDWEYWLGVSGEIVYMSPSCKEITGYDPGVFVADPDKMAAIVHPDDWKTFEAHRHNHSEHAGEGEAEFRILTRNGDVRWIHHRCRPVFDRDGAWRGIRAGNRDVTERRRAEAEVRKLNRLYRVLSGVNQLIVHRPDPDYLYQTACDIAVDEGGFSMAWIGKADETGRVVPLACSGGSRELLEGLGIHLTGPTSQTAVATALREKRTVVIHDLPSIPLMSRWNDVIDAYRLGAAASVPIFIHGDVRVAFTLYTRETEFFDPAEVNLLEELANDIAHALIVAELDQEQERSREQLRLAASVFESSSEGVLITDRSERVVMVNRAFTELTGYLAEEVLGQTPRMLQSGHHGRDFYAAMWASIRTRGHWQGEIWNRRKDGEAIPELLSVSEVKDAAGAVTHYVGVFTDISRIKESEAQLDYLARHDALTGLPNRLKLSAKLEHALERMRREKKQLALLLLDLDRFKDVNDSFGHAVGDELLQQAAGRLTARLRAVDTISRLGGDEFTVLLEDIAHLEDAARVARDIIEAMNEPFRLSNGSEVRIGASVGIALYPDHADSEQELLQQADAALYRAKAEGRNRFKYFSDDLTHAARARIALEARLRRAIAQDELRVYFQPQLDMASGRITGAEALLRWHDAEWGAIPPSRFIPLAEETGLIDAIGAWVLRETCRQGKRWLDAGLPALTLAVNVSPFQLRHGDVSATVAEILAETGFPAHWLELELTESALMEREDEAVEILEKIRALGVRLALDDFGTGYSSLAYLKRFPLDVLKIDKRFVDDIPHQRDDMEIAAAIVAIGHTLHFKVLAEGVETEEQLAFLSAQGCDAYQGYLCSVPLPADDFATLFADSRRPD